MLSRDISPRGDGPQDAEVTFKCLPSRIAFQLLPCRGNSRARGEWAPSVRGGPATAAPGCAVLPVLSLV